jgi:hypothetical protein
MLADSITQHRLALRTADFDPVPLHGKECHLLGWPTKSNASDTEITSWQSLAASRNTGILCKFTPALDIDITNPDAADAVEALMRATLDQQKLGDRILVRTGLPPKRLIPFRTSTPFSKITAKLISADGTGEKLEWLADGQQFVCFGIHPDTRQPYTWRGGEPGQVPRSALPLVDETSARSLIDAAADLLVARFGYRRVEDSKRYPTTVCAPPAHVPVVVADLTTALGKIDPVEYRDRDAWLELLIACKSVGISLQAFTAWSIQDEMYADDGDEIARQWRSIAPGHGGALWAVLKAKGIKVEQHRREVPLTTPSRHHNKSVGDRLIGACVSFKRNPTERSLFSHACLVAEIVHEHRLVPTYYRTAKLYMDLLASAAAQTGLWKRLGAEGCRRSIENGFAHVEVKYRAQGAQR